MRVAMGEQAPDVRDQLRQGRPEVRPIVQVTCGLQGTDALSAASAARTAILNWLRDKQRIRGIPADAWSGRSFEIDATQDKPVSVEAHDHIWAVRYDNPDAEVHGRTWRTEAIVGTQDEGALVGVRLTTISRSWGASVSRSVPRLILDLAETPGLIDYGVALKPIPARVSTESDVNSLVALLEDPARTRPVYVISEGRGGSALVDADGLASRTAGLAHVAVISEGASWELSAMVGSRLSVYGQGVRTYRPGFRRDESLLEDHPVATRDWLLRRYADTRQFAQMLIMQAIAATVEGADLEHRLPSFSRVRDWVSRRRLDEARRTNAPAADLTAILEARIASQADDLRAAESLLDEQDRKLREGAEREAELDRKIRNLNARIASLNSALQARNIEPDIRYPISLDGLEDWVAENLSDRITLLPRAARAAKKGVFSDIRLVCDCLGLLADSYRRMRLGQLSRDEFETACGRLGVELSLTGQSSIAKYSSDYTAMYGGARREFDLHLKKGTDRDARNCLRIYFFWDQDSEQVVVGHLPGHLTTEAT